MTDLIERLNAVELAKCVLDAAEKATPGPWWYQEKSDAYTHIIRSEGNRFILQLSQDRTGRCEADARFIALCREAAPALATALAAREAEIARMQEMLNQTGDERLADVGEITGLTMRAESAERQGDTAMGLLAEALDAEEASEKVALKQADADGRFWNGQAHVHALTVIGNLRAKLKESTP